MEKPVPQTYTAYDYHACRAYLQARDGYDERDVAGKFAGQPDAPYQDFWHFVCDKGDVQNDNFFVMAEWWHEEAEPWQQAILEKYLSAFGTPDASGERSITFWVSW